MSVERKTAWKALDFPAAQRDEELCMLSDKDFLKQFTNTLRSCLMIRKLSTPCKVFVTERITGCTFQASFTSGTAPKSNSEVTFMQITTHNHKHLQ